MSYSTLTKNCCALSPLVLKVRHSWAQKPHVIVTKLYRPFQRLCIFAAWRKQTCSKPRPVERLQKSASSGAAPASNWRVKTYGMLRAFNLSAVACKAAAVAHDHDDGLDFEALQCSIATRQSITSRSLPSADHDLAFSALRY